MKLVSSCITDIGKRRPNNEDWILDWPEKGMYIVADGMGGERHGEVAAQIAVDTVERHIVEHYALIQTCRLTGSAEARAKVHDLLSAAAAAANMAVRREAEERGVVGRMGTTLTMLLVADTRGFVLHIGDSRLYLLRNATMSQVTADHTMGADYERKYGKKATDIDEQVAGTLTRALGMEREVSADIVEIEVRPRDRFVLCTDGVHRYLSASVRDSLIHMLAVPGVTPLEEKQFLDNAVRLIVGEVYRAGAEDNLSAVIVAVREADPESETEEHLRDVAGVAREFPLFSAFDDRLIERLVHASEVRTHDRYEILSFPLRPEGEILVLIEGQLSVLRNSKQIDVIGPGGIIGEVAFFSEKPVNYTLFVDKPSTFLVVRRSAIEMLIADAPQAMARFLWEVCRVMAGHILTSASYIERVERK